MPEAWAARIALPRVRRGLSIAVIKVSRVVTAQASQRPSGQAFPALTVGVEFVEELFVQRGVAHVEVCLYPEPSVNDHGHRPMPERS